MASGVGRKIFEDPLKLALVLGNNVIAHFAQIQSDITKIPTDFSSGHRHEERHGERHGHGDEGGAR